MPDLKKYWQDIRAIQQSLPAVVWLMSLENRAKGQVAGSMAEVAASAAAKLLHARSHRLATEEEIRVHLTHQMETLRQASRQRLRDRGIALIPVEHARRSNDGQ
jgi:hypothetical protein